MSKATESVELLSKGFNCAQAVISTYCADYGFDQELACKVACGFGGGMGHLGETCGAIAGALMLIGLKYGTSIEGTKIIVQEFWTKFVERNKFTRCRELIGIDLLTEDNSVVAETCSKKCPKFVRDAAEIVEELLEGNKV